MFVLYPIRKKKAENNFTGIKKLQFQKHCIDYLIGHLKYLGFLSSRNVNISL